MKKTAVKMLSALLMLSMVFSTSVFAANEQTTSAWDSFLGLFSAKASADEVGVEYRGHIETKGDFPLDGTWIQGPNELGTRGQFLRMEGFWIKLTDAPDGLNIKYNVHVQNEGWLFDEDDSTDWATNGEFAGTKAKMQRIEAVKIVLVDDEGNISTDYDVLYQGHVQDKGDLPANDPKYTGTTGWYENGAQLGTTGSSLRLEALKVKIVQKEADLTAYNAAKAAVAQADYTAASWTTYKAVVDANVVDEDNLQSEVDAATAAITEAQKSLVKAPKVKTASAVNGTLTAVLEGAVEGTPAVTDFKIIQNINGATKAVNASSVQWDATTQTAKLAVPTIYANEVDQNVSYSVAFKETSAVSATGFTVAKVIEVKVESVTALNSKQIQVVFNQEMNKTSVQTLANYKLAANPNAAVPTWNAFADLAAPATVAELQADKKTVIITLGDGEAIAGTTAGVLNNKTALGLQVAALNTKSVSGKVLEKNAEITFQLNDTVAPVVQKVEVSEAGGLVISFNEQILATAGTITVNGFTYNIAAPMVTNEKGISKVTIAKADLIDVTKAKLELNKAYSVAVAAQQDAYGKAATSVFVSNFTYSPSTTAPVLKSVTALDEKSFILEFNKDVTLTDGNALTVTINKGAQQLATTATINVFDGRQIGQYKVVFDQVADLATDVLYDRAKSETTVGLTVYIPAIKDAVGNITAASSTSVTLSKDVTKPAVEKAVSSGTALEVTLNKAPLARTDAQLAAGSYVLAENGRQIPVIAADFTEVLTGGTDKIFTFTYQTGGANALTEGNYTLVVNKDTITDQSLNGGNKNAEMRIPFTVGADLQVKPEINGAIVANGTPGEVKMSFSAPVTYSSVANYLNYKIDGIVIPGASTFVLDATGKDLTITLPEASYKETKDRVVTVSGARNLAGTVMDEAQQVVTVSENEEIKLQSAKVVDGYLLLTFNENVNTATLGTPFAANGSDFTVKINGTATAAPTVAEADGVADLTKVAKNQLRLTAPVGVSYGTGSISVEVIDGALARDAAGNKATAVIVNATR